MTKPIRILVVEDDSTLLAALEASYRSMFSARGYQPTIEHATTVEEARRLAKLARSTPYDFVSLDVILGDRELTGLDILATLKRFQAAWMVALLTGVESDATVDKKMGVQKGESLRKQLRRDAYARFPAERLLVVEKPASGIPADESRTLLANRLEQIALVYEEVGRLRYIFRQIDVVSLERVPAPRGKKVTRKFIETTSTHWQIRFNCGEIRTLPDMAGFRTLHYLLSRDRSQSVTPEEALANEPKNDKVMTTAPVPGTDPLAAYFEAQGIVWTALPAEEQEALIRAALSLKIRRYTELRGFQDEGDLSPAEEAELNGSKRELGPLADAAESVYLSMTTPGADKGQDLEGEEMTTAEMCEAGLHVEGGNYDKLGTDRRGMDSPAAQLFRARMKRVKDCLRENGFAAFAQHIEDFVQSTGANWSYNAPDGIEWTTS